MNKKIKETYITSAIIIIPLALFAISTLFPDSIFFEMMFGLSTIFGIIAGLGFLPYVIYMIIFSIKTYKETKNWRYIIINLALIVVAFMLFVCWVYYHQV